ncbi:MAG: hypothetical protein WCD86_07995, partial [Ktedonobacteraceae bacterium]
PLSGPDAFSPIVVNGHGYAREGSTFMNPNQPRSIVKQRGDSRASNLVKGQEGLALTDVPDS